VITQPTTQLYAQGKALPSEPDKLGTLRDSSDIAHDVDALRRRMEEEGYLFLPGLLSREDVFAARRDILERVAAEGGLQQGIDLMDGVLRDDVVVKFRPDLTRNSASLRKVLFDGQMTQFFEQYLGGPIRPFDFIWLRAVSPGHGTAPHGDSVFMNRGTTNLYTAWMPLGDIDRRLGGLMILENSHTLEDIKQEYGQRDVDTYCDDDPNAPEYLATGKWAWNGQISDDPVELRDQLGGRWLTADFRAGDLLVFTMYTLHASLDNQSTNLLRLSTDTRYQLASDPVDERWVGENPIGHGPEAKKSIIC
jgi:hypothetical protein